LKWLNILPDIWMFRDSCNVYAVRGPKGCLIIDAGTGYWLDAAHELPAPPVALACTHFFRDHSAGAARASRKGIATYVPEYERSIFADPQQHFRQRETYIIYDNQWDLFAPIEPAIVTGVLRDHEKLNLAGLDVEVVPLPGVTMAQVGLQVILPTTGQKVVFCGEAIHSPGRLARIAPLQYNYNDLPGAVQCSLACEELLRRQPDALLPSLGEPILTDACGAVKLLQQNLRTLASERVGTPSEFGRVAHAPLLKVTDHVYQDTQSMCQSWFLISDSGKAMVIDYGYYNPMQWPNYSKPYNRRPLLHGLEGLKQLGIDNVDVALVSHYHDDHVSGIPQLQRLFGTECWCPENFADLLEFPEKHCFPCDWPVPARIDRRLPLDQTFQWEEYTFHLHPMNGHTRWSALIGFEADGRRFAHTGDQYFFLNGDGNFSLETRHQNHVYRNGALLNGYDQSGAWMLDWRPEVVITSLPCLPMRISLNTLKAGPRITNAGIKTQWCWARKKPTSTSIAGAAGSGRIVYICPRR